MAVAEAFDDLRSGNFVNIGDQNHVAHLWLGGARESGEYLSQHRVTGEVFATPGVALLEGRACCIQDVVYDLVVPFCEAVPVLLYIERFGAVFEVYIGFEDDEVVDLGCELAKTDFHPLDLGINHEKIVDLSFLIPVREGFPSPCLAVVFCFFEGKEVWGIGRSRYVSLTDYAQYISFYCAGAAEEVYGCNQQSCREEVPEDGFGWVHDA